MRYFQLFAVSTVVMCLSHTIAKERMFLPLRKRLGGMDTWRGYLVSCPYCLSHWLAFAIVPLTGTFFIEVPWDWGAGAWVASWILSSILVVALAAFLRVGFYFIDEGQKLTREKKVVVADEAAEVRDDHAAHPPVH